MYLSNVILLDTGVRGVVGNTTKFEATAKTWVMI